MGIVCFIILHYNCLEETRSCVDSIIALEQQERIRIVIVDNASVDDSYKFLTAEYESNVLVSLLHNSENLGFSRANNIGYEYAKKYFDLEFVVFANNDVVFMQKDFLGRIDREFRKSKFSVCGPDIIKPEADGALHQNPMGTEIIRSKVQVRKTIIGNYIGLLFFPLTHFLLSRGVGKLTLPNAGKQPEYAKNVLLCGACLIFSADFLRDKKIPFFPETFFYYEEYILAYYCMKHEKSLIYTPELRVYHNHGASTDSLGDKKKDKFRMKNMMLSAKCYLQLLKVGDV